MNVRRLLYSVYERRLQSHLDRASIPRHVGVILDGNRRWARSVGASTSHGHRAGADRIAQFLGWSQEVGIEIVTLWMLSTDNLARDPSEIRDLLHIIAEAVKRLADQGRWRLHIVGDLSLLPARFGDSLTRDAQRTARIRGMEVNIAVGYGGRHEIADAVRAYLREAAAKGRTLGDVAETLTDRDIGAHLYTHGQPDPDLVIRTSGEQRLSGFMLWQSVHSEFYFCETYWPAFRKVDFLRALRDYSQRERRMGR